MNVDTITAICAIVIALASLSVSLMEARTARQYNRYSVKPVLQIIRIKAYGDLRVGLKLRNVGLGLAVIVNTAVTLDGKHAGSWDRDTFDLIVGSNRPVPRFSTLYENSVIPAGEEQFLIFIDHFKLDFRAYAAARSGLREHRDDQRAQLRQQLPLPVPVA
jgi:hypothetical protein